MTFLLNRGRQLIASWIGRSNRRVGSLETAVSYRCTPCWTEPQKIRGTNLLLKMPRSTGTCLGQATSHSVKRQHAAFSQTSCMRGVLIELRRRNNPRGTTVLSQYRQERCPPNLFAMHCTKRYGIQGTNKLMKPALVITNDAEPVTFR